MQLLCNIFIILTRGKYCNRNTPNHQYSPHFRWVVTARLLCVCVCMNVLLYRFNFTYGMSGVLITICYMHYHVREMVNIKRRKKEPAHTGINLIRDKREIGPSPFC